MNQPINEELARAALQTCDDKKRFMLELEFVQCLANPHYINWLAQNRYFDDPAFVNFLKYLQYWKRPEYAHFITYPHALHFLDLLQDAQFRQQMANSAVKEMVHVQQLRHWQFYRDNRLNQLLQPPETVQENAQVGV